MSYEKRVGDRMSVGDLTVRWSVVHPDTPKRGRRANRTGTKPEAAYLRDVSASGASLVARTDASLVRGRAVRLELADDIVCVGRIRRVVETADPAWTLYGMEFADQSAHFAEWLRNMIEHERSGIITESAWRSAY